MSTNDTKISDFTNVLKQFYTLIKDTLLTGYVTEDELSQKRYLTSESEVVREKAKKTELHTHTNKSVLDATTASYTAGQKKKLDGIEKGAKANVQPDWNTTDPGSDAYIKNKPIIPERTSQLMNDSGFAYNSVVGVNTEYGATNIEYTYYDADTKSFGGETGLPNLQRALQDASEKIANSMAKMDEHIPEVTTMTGATTDADGTGGLVPAPAKGAQNRFLRADGTWVTPPESSFDETDPTVPDWAKQPTKPAYTAADVGAEPEGTVYDLIGVKKASDGKIRSGYILYDRLRDTKEVKDYYGKLADMIYTMSNGVANAMTDICKNWTPNRKSYSIGYATAADSVLITDNGIITLCIYKISNDQLMAVNQYVYVSDTYGDNSTFVGKLAANTGALSNTYGTIAVNAANSAVKVSSVKGYRIEITVMECLY